MGSVTFHFQCTTIFVYVRSQNCSVQLILAVITGPPSDRPSSFPDIKSSNYTVLTSNLQLIIFSTFSSLSRASPFAPLPIPGLLSLTPYLSEQFHGCINQVQTIRWELVPVLPSTSSLMACNTLICLPPLSLRCVRLCLHAYVRICVYSTSQGNNCKRIWRE